MEVLRKEVWKFPKIGGRKDVWKEGWREKVRMEVRNFGKRC